MKTTTPLGKNLKLAGFFVLGVIFLIILSLFWKLTILIAQSTVDSKHQFIVAVGNPTQKIICFTPETHRVSILVIKEKINKDNTGKIIAIPVDAYIQGNAKENLLHIFWKSMFTFTGNDTINAVDKAKLWWYIRGMRLENIGNNEVSITMSEDIFSSIIQKLFLDKSLYQEAKTIQIINATGIPGFGGKLAKLLTNIGGNVIIVNTGKTIEETSLIQYTDELSYSDKRIQKILHIQMSKSEKKPVIADIIITIGKDTINTKVF